MTEPLFFCSVCQTRLILLAISCNFFHMGFSLISTWLCKSEFAEGHHPFWLAPQAGGCRRSCSGDCRAHHYKGKWWRLGSGPQKCSGLCPRPHQRWEEEEEKKGPDSLHFVQHLYLVSHCCITSCLSGDSHQLWCPAPIWQAPFQ